MRQVLVVIGGLPAVGKSTIATLLGSETSTPYLRVDRIEHAIVESSALSHPLGPAGYAVAHALAEEQLRLGLDVIVECVNPLSLTRDAWMRTATAAGAGILEIEVVCSDETEHRRRVEVRSSDVERVDETGVDSGDESRVRTLGEGPPGRGLNNNVTGERRPTYRLPDDVRKGNRRLTYAAALRRVRWQWERVLRSICATARGERLRSFTPPGRSGTILRP